MESGWNLWVWLMYNYIHINIIIWFKPPLDQVNCRGQSAYYIYWLVWTYVYRWSERGVCTYTFAGFVTTLRGAGIPCIYICGGVSGLRRWLGTFGYEGACASAKSSCIAVASQRRLTSER